MTERGDPRAVRALLLESAPLAHRWASRHCVSSVYGNASCRWYHGIWQYLAALDLVSTPWRESEFFQEVLTGLLRDEAIETVLVSGASDYAMLAQVHEAARHLEQSTPRCVVIDTCETPLLLNRWYADRKEFPVETRAGDVLLIDAPASFDLVCTHAFLGNFPVDRRKALVTHWYRLLKPGGRVVSINRVRPGAPTLTRFTPEQADEFRKNAAVAARGSSEPLEIGEQALDEAVRRYTRTYVSHPVSSEGELASLFTDCGFRMERFDVDESRPQSGGPSSSIAGTRVRFVARRPLHGHPGKPA